VSTAGAAAPDPPLDPLEVPLAGTCLIEAAAGTGKTHAVTELYLRLLLEAALPVEAILVVTYTRAATAELRGRIRERLAAARDELERGPSPALAGLVARAGGEEAARARLAAALRSMDLAAVHTIHGFCQQALAEHAFAAGLPLGRELLAEQQALLLEVVEDFWRREMAVPGAAPAARERRLSPDGLARWVSGPLARLRLEVRGPRQPPAPEAVIERRVRARAALARRWRGERRRIEALLCDDPSPLNRARYRVATLRALVEAIEAWLEDPAEAPGAPPEGIERLAPEALAAATKGGQEPPAHPAFAACRQVAEAWQRGAEALAEWERALRVRLLEHCRVELARRRRARAQLGYDDLLLDLASALEGDDGRLAAALAARYRAALIDEFQDTDPVQLEIVERIFAAGRRPLFLVGDPKQAIYRFRGADLFAYLAARGRATRTRRLAENWRSTPPLVAAVNALFASRRAPFVLPEVGFAPVRAAPGASPPPLTVAGEACPALRVWLLRRGAGGKVLNKGDTATAMAAAAAAEAARLIELGRAGAARLGERALAAGDIAVLVRSHLQGRAVRAALEAAGVACVRHGQDDVFASAEAEELERVLRALLAPGSAGRVRAALATPLFGLDAEGLAALEAEPRRAELWAERFARWQRAWRERGLMAAFLRWSEEAGCAARLLAAPGGERALTNLRHLAERLHGIEHERGLGPAALTAWLAARRSLAGGEDAEAQLRLERDGEAVQVLTVHAAKGLQFPVVLLPFAWSAGREPDPRAGIACHEREAGGRETLWLVAEPPEQALRQARLETLAEELRLLYVAVTRARSHCVLAWGAVRDAGRSALAWLLCAGEEGGGEDPVAALAERFAGLDDAALERALAGLAGRCGGALAVEAPPAPRPLPLAAPPGAATEPRARSFAARIASRRELTSFTALLAGHAPERPDHDAAASHEVPAVAPAPGGDRFAFPRGARAGSCLHALLERFDPRRRESLAEQAAGLLAEHGFDPAWAGALAGWIDEILATPLGGGAQITLAALPSAARRTELEFHFPVSALEPRALARLAAGHGIDPGAVASLERGPLQGFVHGYIDLVFRHGGRYYLADYKSTWLGEEPRAYRQERLEAVIGAEAYPLQFLLYSVALHRHLAARLPGYDCRRHLGGVYYLFLRGMSPAHEPGTGVYFRRLPAALITALDALLGGR